MKKTIALILTLVMLVAIVGGCGTETPGQQQAPAATPGDTTAPAATGDDPPQVIRIGVLHALTGPLASVGQDFVSTIEAAVDVINNPHPELGDFPFAATIGVPNHGNALIELVLADTQGNPEIAAVEADRLINSEGVVAIIGGHISGVAVTMSNVAERNRVPYFNATATSPALNRRGLEYFFRSTPCDEVFLLDTFEFLASIRDEYGLETIAIVAEETEFGVMVRDIAEQYAEDFGFTIVESFVFPASSASVTSEAIRIAAADPDILFQVAFTSDAILFSQTFRELDVRPQIWMGFRGGFISQEWLDAVGDAANYVMNTQPWSRDLMEFKPFTEYINNLVMQHTGGVGLNGDYAREFDGVIALVDAINRADEVTPEAITRALRETNIGPEWLLTPFPGISFDETGHNRYGRALVTQMQNLEHVTVFPPQYASADMVVPMPPWN